MSLKSTLTNTSKQVNTTSAAKVKLGTNAAISIITAAAILLMVNYLASRHYLRADWTSSGIYTLSDKTEKVLNSLDKEVSLYVLWSQGDPLFEHVKEVLTNYQSLNSKLKVEMLDVDKNPEKVELILQKYGAKIRIDESGESGVEAGIFVVCGETVHFIASSEFEDYSSDMMQLDQGQVMSEFRAEQTLTSAIMTVISNKQTTVCFTQGHGEWSFEGTNKDSLRHIKEELKRNSFISKPLILSETGKVPKTCELVVVAGPAKAFIAEEADFLGLYLERGGKLILLLDPIIEEDRFMPTGLEKLTAKNGIKLINDFVLETDPRRVIQDTPVTFIANEFFNHASVKPLSIPGPPPVVFSIARSLQQVDVDGVICDVLAKSSPMSWGEVNIASLRGGEEAPQLDQYDTDGPLVIAMAVIRGTQDGAAKGKLIVVGDSEFMSEELFVNAGLYNQDFWSGLVGWMTARSEMISIAPKNPEQIKLNLTEEDGSSIVTMLVVEIIFIILIGVIVIIRRRR